MDELGLLLDLHVRNDRQGPGGEAETRRAVELAGLDDAEPLTVADVGCGTGASTLVLASALNAEIHAVDSAAPFIERLRERAAARGVGDRIVTRIGSMETLPFAERSLDLLWCESAIYNIGFAAAIGAWWRLIRPDGVLVVSELTWTTARRPAEVHDHWTNEYPGITGVSANIRALEEAGYSPLAFFFLPDRCWLDNYYGPLRAGFDAFRERHGHSDEAERIITAEEAEARLYREHGRWYGYAFYVARRVGRDGVTHGV